MPRTKLGQALGLGKAPKKGYSGKLLLVKFSLPRRDAQEYFRLVKASKQKQLTQSHWFAAINEAIKEFLADVAQAGEKISTSDSENITFNGYNKVTESDANININGNRPKVKVVTVVERRYLYGLPSIRHYNPKLLLENYMLGRDEPVGIEFEINSKLLAELTELRNKYGILEKDLISQSIDRKAARLRLSGIYSDVEVVEQRTELKKDTNRYNPHGQIFQPDELI
ncbi:hypothetical protein [Chroococcidiopsis sp. CCMEE 29]|uniref:hypothetical protein n=1 Tax=Chroococcidiopsis sp. CCMEE 29 TaxID=155894 RepID=UPI00202171B6|nr:hypothetical protein [Chroococcidiopsis sp. CCMEE 29]